jgi:hypothetical protein
MRQKLDQGESLGMWRNYCGGWIAVFWVGESPLEPTVVIIVPSVNA